MDFLTDLNEQAEKVFNELIAAKRAAKEHDEGKPAAAYHRGRAEELEKWWCSLEEMITKIIERKEAEIKTRRATLKTITDERDG